MPMLTNIDAVRNKHRFYMVHVSQNLFGEWNLIREWGRIGSPGTVRCETFDSESQARDAEQRTLRLRMRHGYVPAQE
jgi:predicted DNA-binding WGR domain protein